jgi:GNAT superfamily N-acetyltransferase
MKKYGDIRVITPENIQDFINLYRVFEEPPYEEFYTDEDLVKEYNRLTNAGHVMGYYVDGKCIGMTAFYKAANENGLVDPEHPIHYEHPEKVAYFSDVTVLKEHRCKGIGSALMEYALETSKNEGCDIMYMRTLQAGQSMSYGIAIKHGFKVLDDITQNIVQARVSETRSETDNRIFLEKMLV